MRTKRQNIVLHFFICFMFLSSVAEKMDNAAIIAIILSGILSIIFVLYVVLAIP